ncbi:MAG: hypothetical protein CFH39_02078 [Alphaproteobacteria bacterium MarineAlpha10_Bin2]|nr:MAG: hypothetical protein CFH39_02078 [Alphaproteobacteria bacterium MarineAlpha10_Bin2]
MEQQEAIRVAREEAVALRAKIRRGLFADQTAGAAPHCVQGNLVILPSFLADDFHRYCEANPKPCPLLAVSKPGDPALPTLAEDFDLRTDVPLYRIYRHGELERETTDIRDVWEDDFVGFVLGCSYSFEAALLEHGIPLRHIERNMGVPMFVSNIATVPAGPFAGPMVVSMRPMFPEHAHRAAAICAEFERAHGEPVQIGNAEAIGVSDIMAPDFGEAVPLEDGEIPVFWACGVTPQMAIKQARPDICITHAPGFMVISDIAASELAAGRGPEISSAPQSNE